MSDFDSGDVRITADASAAGLEVTALAGGAISGINANTPTTIVTYTAPVKMLLSHISVSGTIYAKYQLYLNTALLETRRGGPDRTLVFEFVRPLRLQATDILDVKVIHFQTGATAEFESTVYGG